MKDKHKPNKSKRDRKQFNSFVYGVHQQDKQEDRFIVKGIDIRNHFFLYDDGHVGYTTKVRKHLGKDFDKLYKCITNNSYENEGLSMIDFDEAVTEFESERK